MIDSDLELPSIEISWQDVARNWSNNIPVISGEMGGLGDDYEMCIQIIIFGILDAYLVREGLELFEDIQKEWDHYIKFTHPIIKFLNEDEKYGGFTGGQVGHARSLAWQFMKFGYEHMIQMCHKDRLVEVVNRQYIKKLHPDLPEEEDE